MKIKLLNNILIVMIIWSFPSCSSKPQNPKVRFYFTSDQNLAELDSFKIHVFDKNYELSQIMPASYTEYEEVSNSQEFTNYTGESYINGNMEYGEGRVYLSKHNMSTTLYKYRKEETFVEETDYLSEFKLAKDNKYTVVMVGHDMYITLDNKEK